MDAAFVSCYRQEDVCYAPLGKNETVDKKIRLSYKGNMDIFTERINNIKASILKFVPAKCIYLFGSYAYGKPTEKSDIDIYVVTPDYITDFSELYGKIIGDLSEKDIFFIDLLLGRETVFNARKVKNIFEKTIVQKGKIIYGN
jgi:predicted nucleotidyltransferase